MSAPPEELPGPTRSPVRRWRVAASVLIVAGAAVVVLPDLLGLDRHGPFVQLVAFRPALVGAAALLTALAVVGAGLRRRGRTLAVGLLAVTAVGVAMVAPRAVPERPPATSGRTLTVLSFNVYEGSADVDALAAEIRSARPDLIALPESAGRFRDRLAPLVPGYRFAPSQERGHDVNGVTAAVRADLGDVAVQVDRSTGFPSVELSGGGLGDVRFVAFHSIAPTPGEVGDWSSDLSTLDRWCADRQAGPVIIAGDFNASLDHSVFRDAIQGCTDSAERTGEGLAATWPSRLPRYLGTQIDHVLVTGGITPQTLTVLDLPGSDHRAVLSRLQLP